MDVRCDKCQARYRIDDARVGPNGLTMRCGKCGNTFKVSKDASAAPAASKPPPAPAAPAEKPGSTMMFQAPKIPPKPAPAPSAPPAPPPAAPAENPGSTMMFQAPKIPPKPAPKPPPAVAPAAKISAPGEDSGSTMMFGTAPVAASKPAPAAAPPPKPAARPAPAPAPAPEPEPESQETDDEPTQNDSSDQIPTDAQHPRLSASNAAEVETATGAEAMEGLGLEGESSEPAAEEPEQARPGEPVGDDEVDAHAMTGESPDGGSDLPPAPKAPMSSGMKGAIAGVALVAVLGLAGGVYVMKFGKRPPPPAALEALRESKKLLAKDSLALFAQALETEEAARAAAPHSEFGEAHALRAEIELAWSDALADESALLADKSSKLDDEKKKADADAASTKAAAESKAHYKAALAAATLGAKSAPGSAELHLALADYYRAAKSQNYDRELKKAQAGKIDAGELAAVEGSKLLGEDDGAEKAIAKFKIALAADPQNARIQYRIAQAYALLKNDAEEKKALEATLKLSPTHERAKLLLESLASAAAPAPAAPAPEAAPQ